MKAKDIRNMEEKKRAELLFELQKELMRLRSQVRSGLTPDNPSRIKHVRKDIARLLTINNGGSN
ncbi:50S ribosomal protein L29 [archaeon CG10_big_fil_rev_8_21_14_0_10_43_11]|nr:MAG: 50S ribosomal protein L29 [archaeon CG10_big_fil_rev_8_21_14_0_10_43_11]